MIPFLHIDAMLVIIAPRLVAIIILIFGLVANINTEMLQISQREEHSIQHPEKNNPQPFEHDGFADQLMR